MAGPLRLDPDFVAFLRSLTAREVRFLVAGGYAVAVHGHPRYTGDLDVWLLVDEGNAAGVLAALSDFGFAELGLERADFTARNRVVQLGYPPLRIDLLTSLDGVEFEDCWPRRVEVAVDGLLVPFLAKDDLVRNKRAAGRAQDLADVEALEKVSDEGG